LEGGFVAIVWRDDRERHRFRGAELNDDVDQRLGPFWTRAQSRRPLRKDPDRRVQEAITLVFDKAPRETIVPSSMNGRSCSHNGWQHYIVGRFLNTERHAAFRQHLTRAKRLRDMAKSLEVVRMRAVSKIQADLLLQSLGSIARRKVTDLERARAAAKLVADELGKLDRPDRWCVLNLILQVFEDHPPIFWSVFLEWCYDSEANCAHGLKSRLQRVHRRQPAYEFLSKENRRAFDALPESVEVYRGQEADAPVGFSWTTNREKGEWFAQRFAMRHKSPALLSGTVRKRSVWAIELGRGEDEVLCDPRRVSIQLLPPQP